MSRIIKYIICRIMPVILVVLISALCLYPIAELGFIRSILEFVVWIGCLTTPIACGFWLYGRHIKYYDYKDINDPDSRLDINSSIELLNRMADSFRASIWPVVMLSLLTSGIGFIYLGDYFDDVVTGITLKVISGFTLWLVTLWLLLLILQVYKLLIIVIFKDSVDKRLHSSGLATGD